MPKSIEEIERIFRERFRVWSDDQHNDQRDRGTRAVLTELVALAAACGISLEEPPKCVLCGDATHVARGERFGVYCCFHGNECQNRLLQRYLDQLKQGAR